MKKEDFLDILRDYLKKDFSEDEITDILRDYEEYFVDGIIEGKSEIEIIESLGSPKEIASELLAQSNIKGENKEKSKTTIGKMIELHNVAIQQDDLNDGFLNFWSILEIISEDIDSLKTILNLK